MNQHQDGPTSSYRMPEEVAAGLDEYRGTLAQEQDEAFAAAQSARPSAEERHWAAEIRAASLTAVGLDPAGLRESRRRFAEASQERLQGLASSSSQADQRLDLAPMDLTAMQPMDSGAAAGSEDPNFWYASSRMFWTDPFLVSVESDGFVCRGMKNHNSGNLIRLNFGVTLAYGIAPERLPFSPSGRWLSAPRIEVFGRLNGSSQDSFGFGDDWCKCWMIRRQTAFQNVFAPPGASNRRIIAERTDVQQIFFSEDAPFYRDWFGPGAQPMPDLVLKPATPQTIWVDLEVRFDIQLEGSAQLWIWPHQRFVLRADQWPAVPI